MFLAEKHRPKNINEFVFNHDVMTELLYIASNDDVPHIIITGPPGSGKKTLVNFFLQSLYDENVDYVSKTSYNVSGSSSKKKKVDILQSDYHIVIDPTSTNHDKYILQEVINQYARYKSLGIYKTNRKFKSIVINNIEKLANNSQEALRRTMELFAESCRFIMKCDNLAKISDPLRSRCHIICVREPSINDISCCINRISLLENLILSSEEYEYIINVCDNNLKKAIWLLDTKRLDTRQKIILDDIFDEVIDLIMMVVTHQDVNDPINIAKIFDKNIRDNIYKILITTIRGTIIITTIMNKLINIIKDDVTIKKIIQCASDAEYNLVQGRRDIMHIDYFIIGVMQELLLAQDRGVIFENASKDKNIKKRIIRKK